MKTLFESFCLWIGTILVGFVYYMISSLVMALVIYYAWPIIVPAIFTTGIVVPTIDFSVAFIIGMVVCFGRISFRK